ncbi:unnamed protein product [Closterium sp. NIES-54]
MQWCGSRSRWAQVFFECAVWQICNNPDCLYLHEFGTQEDSYTKEEMVQRHGVSAPSYPHLPPHTTTSRTNSFCLPSAVCCVLCAVCCAPCVCHVPLPCVCHVPLPCALCAISCVPLAPSCMPRCSKHPAPYFDPSHSVNRRAANGLPPSLDTHMEKSSAVPAASHPATTAKVFTLGPSTAPKTGGLLPAAASWGSKASLAGKVVLSASKPASSSTVSSAISVPAAKPTSGSTHTASSSWSSSNGPQLFKPSAAVLSGRVIQASAHSPPVISHVNAAQAATGAGTGFGSLQDKQMHGKSPPSILSQSSTVRPAASTTVGFQPSGLSSSAASVARTAATAALASGPGKPSAVGSTQQKVAASPAAGSLGSAVAGSVAGGSARSKGQSPSKQRSRLVVLGQTAQLETKLPLTGNLAQNAAGKGGGGGGKKGKKKKGESGVVRVMVEADDSRSWEELHGVEDEEEKRPREAGEARADGKEGAQASAKSELQARVLAFDPMRLDAQKGKGKGGDVGAVEKGSDGGKDGCGVDKAKGRGDADKGAGKVNGQTEKGKGKGSGTEEGDKGKARVGWTNEGEKSSEKGKGKGQSEADKKKPKGAAAKEPDKDKSKGRAERVEKGEGASSKRAKAESKNKEEVAKSVTSSQEREVDASPSDMEEDKQEEKQESGSESSKMDLDVEPEISRGASKEVGLKEEKRIKEERRTEKERRTEEERSLRKERTREESLPEEDELSVLIAGDVVASASAIQLPEASDEADNATERESDQGKRASVADAVDSAGGMGGQAGKAMGAPKACSSLLLAFASVPPSPTCLFSLTTFSRHQQQDEHPQQ